LHNLIRIDSSFDLPNTIEISRTPVFEDNTKSVKVGRQFWSHLSSLKDSFFKADEE